MLDQHKTFERPLPVSLFSHSSIITSCLSTKHSPSPPPTQPSRPPLTPSTDTAPTPPPHLRCHHPSLQLLSFFSSHNRIKSWSSVGRWYWLVRRSMRSTRRPWRRAASAMASLGCESSMHRCPMAHLCWTRVHGGAVRCWIDGGQCMGWRRSGNVMCCWLQSHQVISSVLLQSRANVQFSWPCRTPAIFAYSSDLSPSRPRAAFRIIPRSQLSLPNQPCQPTDTPPNEPHRVFSSVPCRPLASTPR